MTPKEKADKELDVITWMNRQGYDRRASKEIAPIIVKYLESAVIKPVCDHNAMSRKKEIVCRCGKCGEAWFTE